MLQRKTQLKQASYPKVLIKSTQPHPFLPRPLPAPSYPTHYTSRWEWNVSPQHPLHQPLHKPRKRNDLDSKEQKKAVKSPHNSYPTLNKKRRSQAPQLSIQYTVSCLTQRHTLAIDKPRLFNKTPPALASKNASVSYVSL